MKTGPRHVLVLGAGMAGLAAARTLVDAGVACTVLEGRDRVGGRIFTARPDGALPLELGAEFVHGPAPELAALCDEAGVPAVEIAGEMLTAAHGRLARCDDRYERTGEVFALMDPRRRQDRTFDEFLASRPGGRRLARERAWARGFVEGFHAADARLISERALASGANPEDEEEQRAGRLVGGYDQLPRHLAGALAGRIQLSTIVESLKWKKGAVEVQARVDGKPRTYRGTAAIVTLPVGVLQARPPEPAAIAIDPMPPAIARALDGLVMGAVTRVVLTFRKPPLAALKLPAGLSPHEISFIYGASDDAVPVWWTQFPLRTPAIVGWVGGPKGQLLSELEPRELKQRVTSSLATALGISRAACELNLTGFYHHDWQSDPFSRGAYAYPRAGHADAAQRLARPVASTLWFAGEACAKGAAVATVHGAAQSGTLAAKSVLRALR